MLPDHLRTLARAAGGVRPLARVLGVHWTTLHRYLAGTREPDTLTRRYLLGLTPAAVERPTNPTPE